MKPHTCEASVLSNQYINNQIFMSVLCANSMDKMVLPKWKISSGLMAKIFLAFDLQLISFFFNFGCPY